MEGMRSRGSSSLMNGFFAFAVLAFLLCFAGGGLAHAPGEVKLAYDQATHTLTVTIIHTRLSDTHYVNEVQVKKNGQVVVSQEYKSQASETVVYPYKIAAAEGDTLEVTAYCSKFGSETQKLKVGKADQK